jgi:hypothetical protein
MYAQEESERKIIGAYCALYIPVCETLRLLSKGNGGKIFLLL